MEFEENDAKIERRSQTTFSIHFFPMLLPRIFLLNRSINRISKERLDNQSILKKQPKITISTK